MPITRTTLAGIALSGILVGGTVLAGPAATAAELPETQASAGELADSSGTMQPDLIDRAIAEAHAAGAVKEEIASPDGSRTVVIDGGDGIELELHQAGVNQRLSAGSDSYGGVYVGFNAFDQNMIISGAAAGLTAGICLLGPAVCAVATVAITIATVAVTTNGGVRCGTKSLRVYPLSNKGPRCA